MMGRATPPPQASIGESVRRLSIFRALSDEQVADIVRIGRLKAFEAGCTVFQEGDAEDGLYVILSGELRILARDGEGNQLELATAGPGGFVGEMAILDGTPRSATVICAERSEFLVLEHDAFISFLCQSASLLEWFLAAFADRIRRTNADFIRATLAKRQVQSEMEIERHRALSQMVAGVAHEINTPLGIANVAVSIIRGRLDEEAAALLQPGEAAKAFLDNLQEAAHLLESGLARTRRLVQSFKNLSVRQMTDSREDVDLAALLDEAIALFEPEARTAHLRVEATNGLPPEMRQWSGFPGHFVQIVLNLLQNAERHAYPEGGGGRIEVGLAPADASRFALTVRDFGRGIPPADLPKIFEPFFTTARAKGGAGLGLSIVQNLVTVALRGTIGVDSEPGVGTTVRIALPFCVPDPEPHG